MDRMLRRFGDWLDASPRNQKLGILLMILTFPVWLLLLAYRLVTEGWRFLVWRHRVERVPRGLRRRHDDRSRP